MHYVDTSPDTLRIDYKTDYVLMVAEAYQNENDLGLAVRRLALAGQYHLPPRWSGQAIQFAQKYGYAEADITRCKSLWNELEALEIAPGDGCSMNGENRGPWYLLTGLVLGIALGLIYAWVFQPVTVYRYGLRPPLRGDFKDQYRALIAAAYLGNGDLLRARARLELLKDEDMFRDASRNRRSAPWHSRALTPMPAPWDCWPSPWARRRPARRSPSPSSG